MKIFRKFYSKIFSVNCGITSDQKQVGIKKVIRPSSPEPDDRSKLSVGLGLSLKNDPQSIKLLGSSGMFLPLPNPPTPGNDQTCIVPGRELSRHLVELSHFECWREAGIH